MSKYLYSSLIFILLISLSYSTLIANAQYEPNAQTLEKTTPVRITVIPQCIAPLCSQWPPEQTTYDVEIKYADGQSHKINNLRASQPAIFSYYCNSYPNECPNRNDPNFHISAKAKYNGQEDTDFIPISYNLNFRESRNTPPTVQILSATLQDGNTVSVSLEISDLDDDINAFNQLSIAIADSNGKRGFLNLYSDNPPKGWQRNLNFDSSSNEITGTVSFQCEGGCQFASPINIVLRAIDASGGMGEDSYTLESQSALKVSFINPKDNVAYSNGKFSMNVKVEGQEQDLDNLIFDFSAYNEITQKNWGVHFKSATLKSKVSEYSKAKAKKIEDSIIYSFILNCPNNKCEGRTIFNAIAIITNKNPPPPPKTAQVIWGKSEGISIITSGQYSKDEKKISFSSLISANDISNSKEISYKIYNSNNNQITDYHWSEHPGKFIENYKETEKNGNEMLISFELDCKKAKCSNKVVIKSKIVDKDDKTAESEATVYISGLMPPNSVRLEPANPTKTDKSRIIATQPGDSDKFTAHLYYLSDIELDDSGHKKYSTLSIYNPKKVQTLDGKTTAIDFVCNENSCHDGLKIGIRALNDEGQSDMREWEIFYSKEIPKTPVLSSTEPSDKFDDLEKGRVFVKEKETIKIIVKMPNNEKVDGYHFYKYLNDGNEPIDEQNSESNVYSITASAQRGDYYIILVRAVKDKVEGEPLQLRILINDPNLGNSVFNYMCDSGISDMTTYMAAGLFAIAMLVAIVYMVGKYLNYPRFTEWSKNELIQLLMIPILFILIVWLISFECSFPVSDLLKWINMSSSSNPIIDPNMDSMMAADSYLRWAIGQTHLTIVMLRHDLGAINTRATVNKYRNQALVPMMGYNGYMYNPNSGDYTTMGTMSMLLNLNTGFLLTSLFQLFSLALFTAKNGFFTLFIPIGFALRSIPFLRGFGGTIVALGVGLFIFYPLMLSMLAIITPSILSTSVYDASDIYSKFYISENPQEYIKSSKPMPIKEIYKAIEDVQSDETSINVMGSSGFTYATGDYPNPKVRLPKKGNSFGSNIIGTDDPSYKMEPVDLASFYQITSFNFIRAFLFPSIMLIITASFIRDLSALLGDEVDASKLVQMV